MLPSWSSSVACCGIFKAGKDADMQFRGDVDSISNLCPCPPVISDRMTQMASTYDCEVAVIGAGPVGLTLALLLKAYGYHVIIFERHPHNYPLPRAVGLDHHGLRIFDDLGISDQLRSRNAIQKLSCTTCEIENQHGEILASTPLNRVIAASGVDYVTAVHQPSLESCLEDQCATRGTRIVRGAEVCNVLEKGDCVDFEFTLRESGGESEYQGSKDALKGTAKFVVGCDGANSIVRQCAGIEFLKQPSPESRWLVVDVLPKEPGSALKFKDGEVPRYYFDPRRPRNSVISTATRRRWEFMVLPEETAEAVQTDAFLWSLLTEFSCTPENAIIERRTVYTVRGAWAETFSKSRLALAGDAAHVTPQFMAQGLNSGLRDAKCLSWRLDLALRRNDSKWEHLMSTYSSEQLGVTRKFVDASIAFEYLLTPITNEAARARDEMLKKGPPPGFPDLERLGSPGFYLGSDTFFECSDRSAGRLFIRDQLEMNGRKAYPESLLGPGWALLGYDISNPSDFLSEITKALYTKFLHGVSASIGANTELHDPSGRYTSWFAENKAKVALIRPDYYVFGISENVDGIEGLVKAAIDGLTVEQDRQT